MTERKPGRRSWKADAVSIISGGLVLVVCWFAGGSRSIGVFLMAPAILTFCLCCVGIAGLATWRSRSGTQALILLALLLAASPLTFWAGLRYGDHLTFYSWAVVRVPLLREASARDQVLQQWSSWGSMAGMENDSFLVVDTTDTLDEPERKDRWSKEVGFGCEMVDTSRLWPRFYLVVTFNCDPSANQTPLR